MTIIATLINIKARRGSEKGMKVYFFFLAISILALLMNVLLIFTVLKIPRFPPEMIMTLTLSAVDMLISLLTIIAVTYHLSTTNPINNLSNACNIKGAIDFIAIFLSMLLVSLIALFRASRIVGYIPLYSTISILGVFSLIFISLVMTCAFRDEFRILEDGIDCAPISSTSLLSSTVLILHSFSLLLFLCITVFCYLRILISTFQTLQDSPTIPKNWWFVRRPVILRTTATILAYLLIILPPAILLFLEATLPITLAKVLNTPIDLFLTSIPLLNPTLILLSHSLLFRQLLLSSQRLGSHFVQ